MLGARAPTAAAPQLDLVPEPSRAHFLRQLAKLAQHQRCPHDVVGARADQSAQPVRRAMVIEAPPILEAPRPQREQAQPQPTQHRQRREPQEIDRVGEPEDGAGVVHPGARGPHQHTVREVQFVDEPHDVDIAREPVVVELLEPPRRGAESTGEAADLRVRFQHGGADAALAQFVSRGQTAEATTDHRDMEPARSTAGGAGCRHYGVPSPEWPRLDFASSPKSAGTAGNPKRSFTT